MPQRPEALKGLFKGETLGMLREQLATQEQLLIAVRRGLPEFLAPHCQHCVLKNQRLLVYVDAPDFATHVRFYAPGLRSHLERTGAARVRDIQVRNLLPASPRPHESRPARAIANPAAISALLQNAAESSQSEEIRNALLRLGRTLRRQGGTRTVAREEDE